MTLASIGDQVKEGTYPFHSRFRRTVNFWCDKQLISVVSEEIGDGPLNIVIRDFDGQSTTGEPAPLMITANTVILGSNRFEFTNNDYYRSTVALDNWDPRLFHHNLSVFAEELRTASSPKSLAFLLDEHRTTNFRPGFERAFTDQIRRGVYQMMNGHLLDVVRTLRGCGLGLTPSGDDFIAGLLIGLNLLQQLRGLDYQKIADDVFRTAKAGNIFSNSFLDLARRGLLFGRMKDLVLALMHESEEMVRKSAARLMAIGGSSGADLGTGFLLTVRGQMGVS
jgi:hypothetical protein